MASWHWRSKHRYFWRSEWDRNGFYQKKDVVGKCVGELMRFYHLKLALSQNYSKNDALGLVLKGEPTGKARYGGEDIAVDVPGNHSNDWHVLMELRPVTNI